MVIIQGAGFIMNASIEVGGLVLQYGILRCKVLVIYDLPVVSRSLYQPRITKTLLADDIANKYRRLKYTKNNNQIFKKMFFRWFHQVFEISDGMLIEFYVN